ncbi:MAG: hypothetical protein ACI9JN_002185 [Bacteroidia bacterium]|jgi:hypothetical protein
MRVFLTAILIAIYSFSFGQIDLYLSNYNVSEEQGSVLVTWTTSAGFTCEDIIIGSGTDSNVLSTVYTYPGICGSEQKEEMYTFLFRDVEYNKPNYFQIDLGKFGTSPVLEITVISVERLNPKVYPNPATSLSTLIFSNPNQETATVNVYKANGQPINQSLIAIGNTIQLSELDIPNSGVYFYTIEIKGILLRGKFLFL